MSMTEIQTKSEAGVFEIIMARPERKNAITFAMYDGLTEALARATNDAEVRVVLLRGEGGLFTSGNDLHDFVARPVTGTDNPGYRFLHALSVFDKPILAAVDGPAIGIGTTMLLHCDLVYAAETARFQLPFVNLGLVPEAGSSLLLPRLVGHPRAAELLFFGEPFDASTAKSLGLVNAVFAPAELLEAVRGRARTLAEKPAQALWATKQLLKGSYADSATERITGEWHSFVERLHSPEAAEALRAVLEKRKPDFSKLR